LLADDAEVAELQVASVADEDVERREVAMERVAAMEPAEHFEDAGDFASGDRLVPSLRGAREVGAEIAVARVLERQAIKHFTARSQQRECIERPNRARVAVEEQAEVGFAQPAVDVRAHLDADRFRHDRRAAETGGEKDLAESALTE